MHGLRQTGPATPVLKLTSPSRSKTVRDYVIAFVLPVIAIATVLAAHAANVPGVKTVASASFTSHR